ncbi:alpha/beta hydrolase [Candidatus Binatia bacterium]|nr:alpha/beta hydrolase [Candidatus Binatia bacterium]
MENSAFGADRSGRGHPAIFLIALSLLLIASCGDSDSQPVLTEPTALPEALSGLDASFHEAIAYGPSDEKNLFDILLPNNKDRAPLVIFFHGGGFASGSRSSAWANGWAARIERLIDMGVAIASVDYRFLNRSEGVGVLTPLQDGALSVQFIRLHAAELGIDPNRIVLVGASAGAGMSLWIGANDDLAEPSRIDPVLRQSTRVRGVILLETQATYDVARWSTDVFPDLGIGVLEGAKLLGLEKRLLAFYGISELEEFDSPEIRAYRARVDMLALLTGDDPPIFVRNKNQPNEFPTSVALLFHHVNHATTIADRAREVGVEHLLYAPVLGIEHPSGEDEVDFALRMLAP